MNDPLRPPGAAPGHSAGGWQIEVPGFAEPFLVLSWSPPRLVLAHGAERRSFHVAAADGGLWIGAGGHVVFRPRADRARLPQQQSGALLFEEVTSPMPGKILEVLVAAGDRVAAGQRLVVIEAMKMESPIRAPHAAVVAQVHIEAGQSIAPGDRLLELEPLAGPEGEAS